MRLVRKLTLALLAGFAGILAVQAWLSIAALADAFEKDIVRDHRIMGRALAAAVGEVWRAHGPEAVRTMIEAANEARPDTRIRWVRLDAPPGDPDAPLLPAATIRTVAAGHEMSRLDRERDEYGTVYTYSPVRLEGASVGAIELSETLEGERRFIRSRLLYEGAATLALIVVCGVVAWLLGVRFVGEPIRALVEQARRIGAGDLTVRLQPRSRDELSLLAEEMNAMTERLAQARSHLEAETNARLAAIEQLRHADRLTTVGRLASGLAHELGTPLNVVSGRADMIASGELESEAEVRATARVIREQTGTMVRIVRQLLDFARRKSTERSPTDLVKLVRETLAWLEPLAEKSGVALRFVGDDTPRPADVDPVQIQQVVTNLVMNAVQAAPTGTAVEVCVVPRRISAPAEGPGSGRAGLCIEVRDRGPGIPETVRARLFDPFFTTKPVGEGTGLGLSVAYGIVADHDGWIEVESAPGEGTLFTVWLPGSSLG